jgi:hypothetical protein
MSIVPSFVKHEPFSLGPCSLGSGNISSIDVFVIEKRKKKEKGYQL